MATRRLTKTETLARLRGLHVKHGAVTAHRVRSSHDGAAIHQGVIEHFGGMAEARAAAGLPPMQRPTRWTAEGIVRELRATARAGIDITHPALVAAGRKDLSSAIKRYFGGIHRARQLSRIPEPAPKSGPRAPSGWWDDERVISEIRKRLRSGMSIAPSRVPNNLYKAAANHFGSWRNALEVADVDYESSRLARSAYSKDQLCAELRRMRREQPAARRTDVYRAKFWRALHAQFGSLDAALDAAGIVGWPLAPQRHAKWTREALVRDIRAHGRRGERARPLPRAVLKAARTRFGSVATAREAAGVLAPLEHWSKKLVIEQLRALAKRGTYAVSRKLHQACWRHFGGIVAARKAAGIERPPK